MPSRLFRSTCGHQSAGMLMGRDQCATCGEPHEFVCWHLRMHELMARYQYTFGVKPIGPHRRRTDTLLGALRTTCTMCKGEGILTLGFDRWARCGQCEGTGGFWTCDDAEVERVRSRILAEFPDAAASRANTPFFGPVVHDLRTGEMLGVEGLEEGEA